MINSDLNKGLTIGQGLGVVGSGLIYGALSGKVYGSSVGHYAIIGAVQGVVKAIDFAVISHLVQKNKLSASNLHLLVAAQHGLLATVTWVAISTLDHENRRLTIAGWIIGGISDVAIIGYNLKKAYEAAPHDFKNIEDQIGPLFGPNGRRHYLANS